MPDDTAYTPKPLNGLGNQTPSSSRTIPLHNQNPKTRRPPHRTRTSESKPLVSGLKQRRPIRQLTITSILQDNLRHITRPSTQILRVRHTPRFGYDNIVNHNPSTRLECRN